MHEWRYSHRFRFSLRSLLVAATVFAGLMAWLGSRSREPDIEFRTGPWPETPIGLAAVEGDLRTLKAILAANPGAINTHDKEYGRTPLHWAAVAGELEIVRELLRRGAERNAVSNRGTTPLQDARHAEVLKLLGNP